MNHGRDVTGNGSANVYFFQHCERRFDHTAGRYQMNGSVPRRADSEPLGDRFTQRYECRPGVEQEGPNLFSIDPAGKYDRRSTPLERYADCCDGGLSQCLERLACG